MYNLMGNSLFFPQTSTMLKTKAFCSQVHFRVDYKPPASQGLLPRHPRSVNYPSRHSPCLQKVCWMTKRLSCSSRSFWTGIEHSKTKTVFLTFLPPPDFPKQSQTGKQTERFNLDLWDVAQGWQLELIFQLFQLELRFQQRLTKTTSVARERLSQDLYLVGGCGGGRPEPWNTVAQLPNLPAFNSPLNSEYDYLSQVFSNQINTTVNWCWENKCICFLLIYLIIPFVSPSLIFFF